MSYYYYGSSSDSCTDASAFDGYNISYTAGQLAIDALGLIASIAIAALYLVLALVRRHTQRVAPWWLFGIAILFSLIAWIIRLVTDVLTDCEVIGPSTSDKLYVPSSVLFYGLVYLMWLAVLIFPLTSSMLGQAGVPAKIYLFIAGGFYAVTCILWISYTAVVYYVQFDDFRYTGYNTDDYYHLIQAYRGLNAAFTTLFFVSSLLATAACIFALTRLRGTTATTGLKIALCIALVFWLGSNILSMVESFRYGLQGWIDATVGAIIATGILDILFLFGAAFGMLFVASSRTWRGQTTPPPYRDSNLPYNYNPVPVQAQYKEGPYNGVQEVSGAGRSTLYPYAPTAYNPAHVPASELASPVTASEVHGQPIRYEAPGHPPAGLH